MVMPSASTSSSTLASTVPAIAEDEISVFGIAHALLVAEGQDLERERQRDAAGAQFLDRDDAGDDAEIAVEAAAVDDRVEMRADQQPLVGARPVAAGRQQAVHGAGRIHAHRQAGAAHPFADQRGGALVLRRQEQAGQLVRLGADRRQRVDHGLRPLAERRRVGCAHDATRSSMRKPMMRVTCADRHGEFRLRVALDALGEGGEDRLLVGAAAPRG